MTPLPLFLLLFEIHKWVFFLLICNKVEFFVLEITHLVQLFVLSSRFRIQVDAAIVVDVFW
ncbi:hypothetical protein HanXRQr2_Chr17g0827181 [Helianthus annuus]|uniref:Uncharacterized protein n=1 Tax=Helianthus annuus TaxID=4232 RepID=A0A9K3GX50_HELAN|nr:hypothetical protein HanXRQr2_Chr17g0827181 [Helianthus annuus]